MSARDAIGAVAAAFALSVPLAVAGKWLIDRSIDACVATVQQAPR